MRTIAKAIVAGLTSLAAWGTAAASDGIDGSEWFGLALVAAAFFGVWAVPNQPDATHNGQGDLTWPEDDGQADLLYVLKVIALVLLIIIALKLLGVI